MRSVQPRVSIISQPRSAAAIALYVALVLAPGMIIGTIVALTT